MADVECPGCGVLLPQTKSAIEPQPYASAECLELQAKVQSFALEHVDQLGHMNQLALDVYRAQHSIGAPAITTFMGLAGLWLVLELNYTGTEVRDAHKAMADATRNWPVFERRIWGLPTVLAISRAQTPLEHTMAINAWSQAVWRAWNEDHERVAEAVQSLIQVHPH